MENDDGVTVVWEARLTVSIRVLAILNIEVTGVLKRETRRLSSLAAPISGSLCRTGLGAQCGGCPRILRERQGPAAGAKFLQTRNWGKIASYSGVVLVTQSLDRARSLRHHHAVSEANQSVPNRRMTLSRASKEASSRLLPGQTACAGPA